MGAPRKYVFKNVHTGPVYVREIRKTLTPGQEHGYEGVLHERTPNLKGKFLDIQDLGPLAVLEPKKRLYSVPVIMDRPSKGKAEAVKFVDNLEEKPNLEPKVSELKAEEPKAKEPEIVPEPVVEKLMYEPVVSEEPESRLDKLVQDNPYTKKKGKKGD